MTRFHCVARYFSLPIVLLLVTCLLAEHRVLMQGNGKLAIVAADGEIEWEMKWGGIHDIHVLANGNVMVQKLPSTVAEIDRNEAVVKHDVIAFTMSIEKRVCFRL